ncbi:uncharacterized protein PG998_003207 [Apiospora kogelbergensis]|uniref:uncharacterized protein n=1 Tax=Apiospora kogelbergensis TaxID=1337665 RepID=UPI003131A91B
MSGPFALPIPAYRLGANKSRRTKRRRTDVEAEDGITDDDAASSGRGAGGSNNRGAIFTSTPSGTQSSSSSRRHVDSINPRSYSPDTLRQMRVAGLDPEEELPSQLYPKFPHKAIPFTNEFSLKRGGNRKKGRKALTSGSEADVDTDLSDHPGKDEKKEHGNGGEEDGIQMNSARMTATNTAVALLHNLLYNGDIPGATRIFDILTGTQDFDPRAQGFWELGLEILLREGEQQQQQVDIIPDVEEEEKADEAITMILRPRPDYWDCSVANLGRVREYLVGFIQHYPYDQHRPHMTSALHFWPRLFDIEMHNLVAQHERAMRRRKIAEDNDEDDNEDGGDSEGDRSSNSLPGHPFSDDDEEGDDDQNGEDRETRRLRRREDARQARRHRARDRIRARTRAAAEQLAARMDQQMENRPYGTHGELLRLRGLLSLVVGELHLPYSFVEKVAAARDENSQSRKRRRRGYGPPKSMRKYARTEAERAANRLREAEMEKARRFFRKMLERPPIILEDWVHVFAKGDDDDEDEEDDD